MENQIKTVIQSANALIDILEMENSALSMQNKESIDDIVQKKQILFEEFQKILSISESIILSPANENDKEELRQSIAKLNKLTQENHFKLAKEILFRQELLDVVSLMLNKQECNLYDKKGQKNKNDNNTYVSMTLDEII